MFYVRAGHSGYKIAAESVEGTVICAGYVRVRSALFYGSKCRILTRSTSKPVSVTAPSSPLGGGYSAEGGAFDKSLGSFTRTNRPSRDETLNDLEYLFP